MKKLFFSFVMLVTLVIVAGSAKAQIGTSPYPGGTYTYTLSGIALKNDGTVKVEYSVPSEITITPKTGLGETSSPFTISKDITSISFDVKYSKDAEPGEKTFTVTITDETTKCYNFIKLDVTIKQRPTIAVSILASETDPICQKRNETPGDNSAAAVTANPTVDNTFTYKVTPVVSYVASGGNFDYTYDITLPTEGALLGFGITNNVLANGGAISGTKVTYTGVTEVKEDIFTITFKTTTGQVNQTLNASLGATPQLTVTSGGGVYDGTVSGSPSSVVVKSMPSIGTFSTNP